MCEHFPKFTCAVHTMLKSTKIFHSNICLKTQKRKRFSISSTLAFHAFDFSCVVKLLFVKVFPQHFINFRSQICLPCPWGGRCWVLVYHHFQTPLTSPHIKLTTAQIFDCPAAVTYVFRARFDQGNS